MSRKKRSHKRIVVGPKMRSVATPQPTPPAGLAEVRAKDKAALFEELARSLKDADESAAVETSSTISTAEVSGPDSSAEIVALLADVATGLWRLRAKMLPDGSRQPSEENRRSYRQLETIMDVMMQAGVQIRDHTGEAVPRGGIYTLKALAYEPTAGLLRDQVIETLKPTIAFKDRVIQTGEVIIGTPITAPD
jgi:hypothetical protein